MINLFRCIWMQKKKYSGVKLDKEMQNMSEAE